MRKMFNKKNAQSYYDFVHVCSRVWEQAVITTKSASVYTPLHTPSYKSRTMTLAKWLGPIPEIYS